MSFVLEGAFFKIPDEHIVFQVSRESFEGRTFQFLSVPLPSSSPSSCFILLDAYFKISGKFFFFKVIDFILCVTRHVRLATNM